MKIYAVFDVQYAEAMAANTISVGDCRRAAQEMLEALAKNRGVYGRRGYEDDDPFIEIWEDGKIVSTEKLSKEDVVRLGLKEA